MITVAKNTCLWKEPCNAFELWCWRRFSRVPWTAKRSNQSVLKEISPEYSLKGLMLELKLQHFGHLTQRIDWKRPWCWERLKVGEEGDNRKWDGWMVSLIQWTWVWVSSGSWWWIGRPGMLQSMGLQRIGQDWVTELSWIELNGWFMLRFDRKQQNSIKQLSFH